MKIFDLNDFIYHGLPTLSIIFGGFYLVSFLNLLCRNFISPLIYSKLKEIRKFGNWVVITGATDGIGKAFAELLAKEKYNLVLLSRNIDKLEKVKSELMSKFQIKIRLIAVDFTKVDIYEKIENEIKGLDVGLLINNVGMSLDFPDYLTGELNSKETIVNLLNCNCVSTILMTKILLNLRMMENGGIILNISSAAGKLPMPFIAVYGASKALISSFSINMRSELKQSQVITQTVVPFYVSTNMSKLRPSWACPSAMNYANSVLNRLGTCAVTHGCFAHELQAWVLGIIPNFILEKMVYNSVLRIRTKAIQKLNKTR